MSSTTRGSGHEVVSVIFTGGTISSVGDAAAGGAVPTLTSHDLLGRIAQDARCPGIRAIDLKPRPSTHFTFGDMFEINTMVRAELADPAVAGVVVVQGTDTIEETSFFLDLLHEGPKPVIVTGSMRTADAHDSDGSANLLDATLCAASDALVNQGVMVVMAGSIDAADDVVKTHSTRLDTFRSPNLGALGRMSDGRVVLERSRRYVRHVDCQTAVEPVFVVEAGLGVDGELVDALAGRRVAGLVVKATGSGNTHPALLDSCKVLMRRGVPVVITTRAGAGRITDTYGFPGGGGTWIRSGAIRAGYLSGSKARVALALGLGAGLDEDGLRSLLDDPA